MSALKIITVLVVALPVTSPFVIAKHHTPEDRGKAMFSDPKFAGAAAPMSSRVLAR